MEGVPQRSILWYLLFNIILFGFFIIIYTAYFANYASDIWYIGCILYNQKYNSRGFARVGDGVKRFSHVVQG